MNKTITITLNGLIFYIEEDAYAQLNQYLDSIKAHLGDDRNEIMQDIEASIAEKFTNLTGARKLVIAKDDVDNLIKIMGTVEDFTDSTQEKPEGKPQRTRQKNEYGKQVKKLYRDPDNMIIAGVCSGLGAFIGVDPVIIRLLFALTIFFGGVGIVVYVVLWLSMPIAETSTQKLEMQGDPVTLVKLQEIAKEKISTTKIEKGTNFLKKILTIPEKIIRAFFLIIKKLFSAFSVIAGAGIIIGSIIAIGFLSFSVSIFIFTPNSPYIFSDFLIKDILWGWKYFVLLLSAYVTVLIPIIFGIFLGIILIKRKNIISLLIASSMIAVWLIAIISLGVISINVAPGIEAKVNQLEKASPTVTRDFDFKDFNEVEIGGNYKINIEKSDTFKISARGSERDLSKLNLRVENNRMYIRQEYSRGICLFCDSRQIEINILMPELVDFGSDSQVKADINGFQSENFKVDAEGMSMVKLVIAAKNIELEADDSAEISLLGSSTNMVIKLSGSAKLNAKNEISDRLELEMDDSTKATLNGRGKVLDLKLLDISDISAYDFIADDVYIVADDAGRAKVFASSTLDVSASYLSRIYYKGNPKVKEQINDMGRAELDEMQLEDDRVDLEARIQDKRIKFTGTSTNSSIIHVE